MKNKVLKNIISTIIAIISMFSIIITMFMMFFNNTLINQDTYLEIYNENQLYEKIYENMTSNMKYSLVVNNVESNILDDVISKEDIKQIIDTTTNTFIGFIKGEGVEVVETNFDVYYEKIEENINKFLRDESIFLDEGQTQDLNLMKQEIKSTLKGELQILDFNELSKSNIMIMISKLVSILNDEKTTMILISINILIMSIFFIIWNKQISRAFLWCGYSLLASGMIVFLISFSGYLSGFYEYVIITTEHIAQTIGLIIKTYLLEMTKTSIVVLIIGILSLSVYWIDLYKNMEN